MLAGHDGVVGVLGGNVGVARRLDDDVHLGVDGDARIVGRDATALVQGVVGLAQVVGLDWPDARFSLARQRLGRAADIEVADDGGLHAGGVGKLGDYHRPEASTPDDGNANWGFLFL